MANPEHVEILKQGAEVWNQWIKRNFNRKIDFQGADLEDEYIGEVDLSGADFRKARLNGADFVRAYFGGTNLQDANLERANLMGSVRVSLLQEIQHYTGCLAIGKQHFLAERAKLV